MKLYSALQIDAIGTKIAAKIKAITAKTNLLKTAAYRDVGTTAGKIPEFVGNDGIGGFGYGGKAINLPPDTDLNNLRYITANYSGVLKPLNFPVGATLLGGYSLVVAAGDSGVKQTLTVGVYAAPTYKFITYERFYINSWTDWTVTFSPSSGSITAKDIAAGSSLDNLPRTNGVYFGTKDQKLTGLPKELVKYIFDYKFVIETLVTPDSTEYFQTLYMTAFKPATTTAANTVIFIRSRNYLGFTEWLRTTGVMYGVDLAEVVGDDIAVNSIKAGATSPKIAYKYVRVDITYDNFGYASDGISTNRTDSYDFRGSKHVESLIPNTKVLSIGWRVMRNYTTNFLPVKNKSQGGGAYISVMEQFGDSYIFAIKTSGHVLELGQPASDHADNLFENGSYIELFVTYMVD